MEKSNKSTKWIIIGSIVVILAILVAVGPMIVMKYMRNKWESNKHYQTTALLMNVSGSLKKASNGVYYLKGNNRLFYVLEGIQEDVSEHVDENCSVIGEFREAKNNETIDGNPVRLFIGVKKLIFKDTGETVGTGIEQSQSADGDKETVTMREKSLKRAKLRVEANTILNKPILFDVIKGNVVAFNRKDLNDKDYTAFVLVDEFSDNYMLYKGGKDLSSLENKNIIVLGREIIPPKNFPLVVDETTFEIYEVYDINYNKLM
ncbi:MAG: hypothetical protein IKN62_05685 [Elusimicrobia bacterium]|nr:hypothetical protein [Elusimicrobiota bacterium]